MLNNDMGQRLDSKICSEMEWFMEEGKDLYQNWQIF